jgi:hypothetical protein
MSLLTNLNQRYLQLHMAKENAFWESKMGLKEAVEGDFETKEIELKAYISDASILPIIRTELERTDLSEEERLGLQGWLRFFEANTIESPEAIALQKKIIEMEGALERQRRDMELGYIDPVTGEFRQASSVELALLISASPDEAVRRAAWEGLRSIERFVLDNGFLDIVRERNRLGRMLGYEDYYDYKVTVNEGFSKQKLFELLDELEAHTRDACLKSVEDVIETKGGAAADPWNFDYYTTGDTTAMTDPYHRFDLAVQRWGELFHTMGIRYNGANLTLDLVDRRGKYENGFMHGPVPGYVDSGTYLPARINFTANAVPGKVGSGHRAMKTLLHEGGHAAHFSNIMMPAPCFSQEFTPTSVALAETQSMFLDSVMNDPDWLVRYAHNSSGEPMPVSLIQKVLEQNHRYRAHQLRKMLAVSYSEKALYEMSEDELTPENVLKVLRSIEQQMLFQEGSSRPILSIPHLISGEASAYYHGYILAQMAVYQTRDFFIRRDGYIMDNPKVGPDLARSYWRPGNAKSFLEIVEDLTGEPFSANATTALVNKSLDEVFAEAIKAIEREREIPHPEAPVDLDATITIIHGDEVIADTNSATFKEMSEHFAEWIRQQEPA